MDEVQYSSVAGYEIKVEALNTFGIDLYKSV